MIDTEKLKPILEGYKETFLTRWNEVGDNEKFKWEAIRHFQNNWDIDASDFGKMFYEATAKVGNLLTFYPVFPRDQIRDFARADDEFVRQMFRELYDETNDLAARINGFMIKTKEMFQKYGDGNWKMNFQGFTSISTYLWLMYPDKYYIYKYMIYRSFAKELDSDYRPQKGNVSSVINGFKMYDEICEEIKKDRKIRELFDSVKGNDCYPDTNMKTITIDVGFYFTRYYLCEKEYENQSDIEQTEPKQCERYTKNNFLREVFMSDEQYETLAELLENKKNIILQGAPGVGKTFAAKKLAFSIMGEADDSRIKFIQFHQNYSYEDFVMGYRPNGAAFELRHGIFYDFCKKAQNDPERKYYLIIDEINRGNMSKILGELMMLIEKDYRGTEITLAYNGEPFSVPKNLYIIGLMNTADRSLAMIDYALRRRFSFFEMNPGFDSDRFAEYQKSLDNRIFDRLIEQIKILNYEIENDSSLGSGFRIGHSYFCGLSKNDCTERRLRSIIEFDIVPTLEEYWFDERQKIADRKRELLDALNDER